MKPVELRAMLDDAGIETREYSGRGMYGQECLAAVADRAEDVYAVIPEAAIRSARTDAMGMQVVVYWPTVPWSES